MWHMAGYYDESDDIERGYAVAGFVGNQHDCVHLDLAWKGRILDKYDLEYFKASELNAGAGQFAKFRDNPNDLNAPFTPREKNLFNEIKIATIDLTVSFDLLIAIGAVCMLPDYYRLAEEYSRAGKTIPAPYFFCSQLMMMESGFLMHRLNTRLSASQQGLIRPVFDSHEQYSGRAKQMFDEFCRKNPISSNSLLPPHYEDEKDYRVLQAADNLAYECRRLLITTEYDRHIPERIAMTRLKKMVYKIYKLNYDAMKGVMEAQSPEKMPFEAEIHNRKELISELDDIEKEAREKRERVWKNR